ncbi:MAG TPA: MtrB/PioB family outer membrane beta-barrel protein [Vicinamibacterales bacterium]|nr:MtrB/PioB family outer membrane beta-barrel protein [Vicinamibacterales bacterium]
MTINMRIRWWPTVAAVFLAPAAVLAQDAAPASTLPQVPATTMVVPDLGASNFVDFDLRGTIFGAGSDEARFQRYRDLRNGPTMDVFHYLNETDSRVFKVQADHVGYRDQRYSASYDRYGKLKVSFEWNQTPLFYSQDTATLFTTASPGVLRIDDTIRSGIQNNTTTLANAVGQAQTFDLRQQRDVLSLKLAYSATQNLDWSLSIKNTTKKGNQPWAGTFGFSDAVELPVPLDTRTTELGTALEWANERGMARLGYDGSFFRNNISTLTWDNPLRVTDSPTAGPAQGRMTLWPNSNMNAASATGMLNLPWRSRATAYVSVGNWSQNDQLIPFTNNSTLPTIPLDRTTADAQARVTAMTYSFTSKPTNGLWFSARYRSYDFDNRTPVFHVANTVAYDSTVEAFAAGGTSPYSLTRRTFDADASLTPFPYTALRVGYTREQINETFRTFDTTTEDTVRLSADATGVGWLTLRAVYEHAKRVGSGLDEQALDDIGEQVSLRQFDISDRTSDRVSAVVQVTPLSSLSFNGTASVGKEDRPGTAFGLQSNNNHSYSVGVDFVPREAVSMGLSYEYEKYDALQASREANPGAQFNDPTRDWTTDGADRAQTVTASMDLIKLLRTTDVRFAYNYSHAESVYVYGLAPNSSLPPVVQLPAVVNTLQRATVDVRYYVTRHLAFGGAYWFDKYRVNDFALGSQTLTTLAEPSFLNLGDLIRPYTANTITGRLTIIW